MCRKIFYTNLPATLFITFKKIINFQTENLFTLLKLFYLQDTFLTLNVFLIQNYKFIFCNSTDYFPRNFISVSLLTRPM
jgi:hypothetical protein